MNNRIKVKDNQRTYTIVYNDFLDCTLLTGQEKLLVILLRRFGDKSFPSLSHLADISGFSRSTVQRVINSLKEKGIVQVINRTSREKGNESNLYVLNDNASMWGSTTLDDLMKSATVSELDDAIRIIKAAGYKIEGYEKNKIQAVEDEYNKYQDRYPMMEIRKMYGYKDLINSYPEEKEWINIAIMLLYETLNNDHKFIRISGQEKPAEIVRSKLCKLSGEDIMYAIDKFKNETNRIKDHQAYMLTLLYHAKEQSKLDIHNKVKHDLGY